ncbi:MAG: hypothetical protein M3495_06660 [Pseudomonadota bacterium]|nr:sugar ABC transporter permease [Gammaproteobacteria bacterium]MDQ3581297.1 hypothetical protein [Pseudomonadota bacterium]
MDYRKEALPKVTIKAMNRLFHLFGDSARWISLVSWSAIIVALATALAPLAFILVVSFSEYHALGGGDGLIAEWLDDRNVNAMGNSLAVGFGVAVLLTVISILAALCFRWCNLTGHSTIYMLSILPLTVPDYVFGVAGRVMFDPSVGLFAEWLPDSLLFDRTSALLMVVAITILKWLPLMIVIADAAIFALGSPIFYQTMVDFTRFRRAVGLVFLPQLGKATALIASLGFLIGFRQHELAYELTSSGAGFDAEMWSNRNYRVIFEFAGVARAAADGLLALGVLFVPIRLIHMATSWYLSNEE